MLDGPTRRNLVSGSGRGQFGLRAAGERTRGRPRSPRALGATMRADYTGLACNRPTVRAVTWAVVALGVVILAVGCSGSSGSSGSSASASPCATEGQSCAGDSQCCLQSADPAGHPACRDFGSGKDTCCSGRGGPCDGPGQCCYEVTGAPGDYCNGVPNGVCCLLSGPLPAGVRPLQGRRGLLQRRNVRSRRRLLHAGRTWLQPGQRVLPAVRGPEQPPDVRWFADLLLCPWRPLQQREPVLLQRPRARGQRLLQHQRHLLPVQRAA